VSTSCGKCGSEHEPDLYCPMCDQIMPVVASPSCAPVLFLDLDGVLNGAGDAQGHGYTMGSQEWLTRQVEPKLVALVNLIHKQTGCCCVLSTSWRNAHPTRTLRHIFDNMGLWAPIVGVTPEIRLAPRDREIEKWLEWAGMGPASGAAFVILDDFAITVDWLRKRSIKCDPDVGLTAEQAKLAIAILRGCSHDLFSSRACGRGTKGCEVRHG